MALDWARLAEIAEKSPKQEGFKPSYGTAGFRAEGSLLHSTMFRYGSSDLLDCSAPKNLQARALPCRCGMLMAARSVKTGGTTGLVVTASHNPEVDNGVKLVEPTGYMLTQAWEVRWESVELSCKLSSRKTPCPCRYECRSLGCDTNIIAGCRAMLTV